MFFRKVNLRIKLLFLFMSFLLLLVIVRVFYIQVFDYNKLKPLADDLWSRDLTIEADRGLIMDRNGVVLADNLTTASLIIIPNQIKDADDTSRKLAEILNVSRIESVMESESQAFLLA